MFNKEWSKFYNRSGCTANKNKTKKHKQSDFPNTSAKTTQATLKIRDKKVKSVSRYLYFYDTNYFNRQNEYVYCPLSLLSKVSYVNR